MLLLLFPLGLLLVGCASQEMVPTVANQSATEQRLADLERRVQQLEKRPPVEAPYRNRDEIQAHISQLEAERGKLLLKYTELNPAVRDIDRKLLILREQLRMLEP
jgi:chromosome segregation ATPase